MGKIYNYLGFIIYFYSNEHNPIHVHVKKNERESKFEFHFHNGKLTIEVKKSFGRKSLTGSEIQSVKIFLKKYHEEILEKWNEVFILHKKTKFVVVNKKVK